MSDVGSKNVRVVEHSRNYKYPFLIMISGSSSASSSFDMVIIHQFTLFFKFHLLA